MSSQVFNVPDRDKAFSFCRDVLGRFTADVLKKFCVQIMKNYRPGAVLVGGRPGEVITDYFFDGKASRLCRVDCERLIALVILGKGNLANILENVPAWQRKGLGLLALKGWVTPEELKEVGAGNLMPEKSSSYSYDRDFDKGPLCELCKIEPFGHYSLEFEYVMEMPNGFQRSLADALFPGEFEMQKALTASLPAGMQVHSIEADIVRSYTLLKGILRQDKYSVVAKPTAIAPKKVLTIQQQLSVPEHLPAEVQDRKVYTFSYSLPFLIEGYRTSDEGDIAECARKAFSSLCRSLSLQTYIGVFMPFLTGLRKNKIVENDLGGWTKAISDALSKGLSKWVSVEKLMQIIHADKYEEHLKTWLLKNNIIDHHDNYIVNSFTGDVIGLVSGSVLFDTEIIKGICMAMYGMGFLQIATHYPEGVPTTPLEGLKYIRLTALGRYALGIDRKYELPKEEKVPYFELDGQRLIVQSLTQDNPYLSILSDMSVPIGGGKYLITYQSFLSGCDSREEFEKKVKFFRELVPNEMPANWAEFFKEISARCYPLEAMANDYVMYKIPEDNLELRRLLTGDASLRKIILRADGSLVLIPRTQMSAFKKILKGYGYLI